MHAFQVLAALIAGAGAVAVHNEQPGQTWEIAEKAALKDKINPWAELMGRRGHVTFNDTWTHPDQPIQVFCSRHDYENGGEFCYRENNDTTIKMEDHDKGYDLCDHLHGKKHKRYNVKRSGDHSVTYIGSRSKSRKLDANECYDAQGHLRKAAQAPWTFGANNYTRGGFWVQNEWAYTINIPLDGKTKY